MLVALLAVAAVVVLIVVRPGSSGGAESASEVQVPADLPTEDPAADPDDDTVPTCTPGQLEVLPVADQSSYAAGELPRFSLSIENTGDEVCTADLGTAGMQFEVSSGNDQVWRSADCQEDAENLAVALEAGQLLETEEVVWDRTRSSTETCDITRDPVSADGASYHLQVGAAGVKGDGTAQFLLH